MDWESAENEILLNPRLPVSDREAALIHLPKANLSGHIWLSTSGSSGYLKWVALPKSALLVSAAAVNQHFRSDSTDRWLNPLPTFHVGGLGILARAFLSGAAVFSTSGWDPFQYAKSLLEHHITLSSLVPAQVFDLVQNKLAPPNCLRAIIVGGARLQPELYKQASELGWPLYPSYGMTEASSQIATAASANDPALMVLPHISVKTVESGHLQLEGPSLFTAYAHIRNGSLVLDQRPTPFLTEDKGFLQGKQLTLLGRDTHFIKIGGESVDLLRLERILEEIKLELGFDSDVALFANEDSRLGHVIHLAATVPAVQSLIECYNTRVLPFEKIRQVHYLQSIPRSPLRKLLLNELKKLV